MHYAESMYTLTNKQYSRLDMYIYTSGTSYDVLGVKTFLLKLSASRDGPEKSIETRKG